MLSRTDASRGLLNLRHIGRNPCDPTRYSSVLVLVLAPGVACRKSTNTKRARRLFLISSSPRMESSDGLSATHFFDTSARFARRRFIHQKGIGCGASSAPRL